VLFLQKKRLLKSSGKGLFERKRTQQNIYFEPLRDIFKAQNLVDFLRGEYCSASTIKISKLPMIKKHLLSLDVGGTSIMGALYTSNLEELKVRKIPCEADKGKEVVFQNLCTLIEELMDEHTAAIALAWAGFVNSSLGIIVKSPNIPGFEGFHITKELSEKFQVPVYIENDTKLFAYAEQQTLHPYSRTFLGIIMGTGIGCGIVINGNIFKGSNGNAGEIGHAMFQPPFALNNEIEKLFTGKGLTARIRNLTGIETLEELGERLKNDHEATLTALNPVIEELSTWLYGIVLAFDPDTIVFGGGVGINIIRSLLPALNKNLSEKFTQMGFPYSTKLESSQILNSGLIGAGILARNNS